MIPVADSLLYIQPLYVESSRNAIPELQQVIAVYGNQNAAIGPTLSSALTQVFAAPVSTAAGNNNSSTALSPQVRALLVEAQQSYQQSQTDLKAGNLGAYQTDINALESDLQEVQTLTGTSPTTSTTTTTTASTTTTSSPSSTTPTVRRPEKTRTGSGPHVPAAGADGLRSRGDKLSPRDAGWSSLVARRAHNPKVVGSNPTPATKFRSR